MILDKWASDASRLLENLPPDTEVADRAHHLLNKVVERSVEVDADYFNSPRAATLRPVPENGFLVVNKAQLQRSPTALGRMAMSLPGVAFVVYSNNTPSVLALPDHNPNMPLGNGFALLHELEHLTEKEAGLYRPGLKEPFATANLGARERRAYRLNTDMLYALDGSDFNRYLESWPVFFGTTGQEESQSAEISFHDTECPIPANETFAGSMWQEGGSSRQLLQSIGRMSVLERVAADLSPQMVDYLAGNIQVSV
jgi:hypothetical protein